MVLCTFCAPEIGAGFKQKDLDWGSERPRGLTHSLIHSFTHSFNKYLIMFLPGCFSITIHGVAKHQTRLSDWTELNRATWVLHFDINKTGVDPALWNLQSTVKVKVAQSWPTLFDPMDCSPSNSPGQDTGVGSPSLLQGIFPTREFNRGLLHCGWILYQRSYQGSSQSISQFSSVQSLSRVRFFATPWTSALQASLSITNSPSPPKPMSIELVMPSNHLILHCPLLLLPSIFASIRVFSNESALLIRWPKYWSFSFNIRPSKEHPGLISFRVDWLDLLADQGTVKSLLQHDRSKTSILRCSAFFIV